MTETLHRLVYYSRNCLAASPEAMEREIAQILATSQANNARVGVTGALMFNQGCFAQVLEGPRSAIEATFERIQQDARHGDVSLLAFGPAEARGFPVWSMAYIGASDADATRYGTIAGTSGFDLSRLSGERIFEVLHGLVLDEEQEAA